MKSPFPGMDPHLEKYCREVLDLDYRAEPKPPLSAEEAAWAGEMLRGKGLRGKGLRS